MIVLLGKDWLIWCVSIKFSVSYMYIYAKLQFLKVFDNQIKINSKIGRKSILFGRVFEPNNKINKNNINALSGSQK
jgi:hypothetical protein